MVVGDRRRPGPWLKVQFWGGGQVGKDSHAGETLPPRPQASPGLLFYILVDGFRVSGGSWLAPRPRPLIFCCP